MRPMTEDEVRESLVNAEPQESELVALPPDFLLTEWDHLDFLAWRDPRSRGRAYLVAEVDGEAAGVVLRAAESTSRARSGLCNICRTLQPGNQVALFTARRAGDAGRRGDSIGTYICTDLSCHENVRLAMPLAPGEVRGSVDHRIDGAKHRSAAFVERVLEGAG